MSSHIREIVLLAALAVFWVGWWFWPAPETPRPAPAPASSPAVVMPDVSPEPATAPPEAARPRVQGNPVIVPIHVTRATDGAIIH